ncbi:MAG: hypothetical protein PWP03_395 [Candidatus Woesearchaeota archaeon]|nr:hypothetical protein [Candidatus Woesearchaeota archaeon]
MDCIFCKIANQEIPSFKIWENDEFIAILDINPNCKGQTLVISKQHYDSDLLKLDNEVFSRMFLAAKEVSNLLKKALNVKRVGLIFEGTGVNHAHIKLYPMHGLNKEFEEIISIERVWFDRYAGYLTSKLGPQANFEELKRLQEMIVSNKE